MMALSSISKFWWATSLLDFELSLHLVVIVRTWFGKLIFTKIVDFFENLLRKLCEIH